MLINFIMVFLLILLCILILHHLKMSKQLTKIKGNNAEIQTLIPLPRMALPKAFLWMIFCGEGRLVKMLRYIGKLESIAEYKFWKIRLVFINDFRLGKELFKNATFCDKPITDLITFPSQGSYGLFNTCGKQWKEQRRFCHQHLKEFGFGTKKMEVFIQNEIDLLIESWCSKQELPFPPNKSFYIPILSSLWMILAGERASTEMVELVFRGYENLQKACSFPEMLLTLPDIKIETLNRIIKWIPIFPGTKSFFKICHELRSYMKNMINQRKSENETHTEQHPTDLVDAYLKKINHTKDPESQLFGTKGEMNLVAVMIEFFFAGGDTTANILAWSMLHLIRNADIQEKIQLEIDLVVGTDRRPLLTDRINCPYTESFLWEVLRMNPVSPLTMPHTPIEDTNIGSYFVKKGTFMFLNIYNIHHDPNIWGDPHNFRPERFLSLDGKSVMKNEAMCAFSLGQRRCLGEQVARDNLFLFVSAICQRFILKPDPFLKEPPPLCDQKSGVHAPQLFNMIAIDRLVKGSL